MNPKSLNLTLVDHTTTFVPLYLTYFLEGEDWVVTVKFDPIPSVTMVGTVQIKDPRKDQSPVIELALEASKKAASGDWHSHPIVYTPPITCS